MQSKRRMLFFLLIVHSLLLIRPPLGSSVRATPFLGANQAVPPIEEAARPPTTSAAAGETLTLPKGTIITTARDLPLDPALTTAPADTDATVVRAGLTTHYGTQAGQQVIPAGFPTTEYAPQGPVLPVMSDWQSLTVSGRYSIRAMVTAPNGQAFVSLTTSGLYRYAPGITGTYQWTAIPAGAGGPASNAISSLAVSENMLWVGTEDAGISLFNLQTNTWSVLNLPAELATNQIVRLTAVTPPTGSPYVWVSTRSGAARYTNGSWLVLTTAKGLPSNDIRDIAVRFSGGATLTWFSTMHSLVQWNGSSWISMPPAGASGCVFDRATRVIVDKQQSIWFGMEVYYASRPTGVSDDIQAPQFGNYQYTGVCHYSPVTNTWTAYTKDSPGLPAGPLTDMTVDDVGRVWMSFGGDNGGAVSYDHGGNQDHWKIYKQSATIPFADNDIQAIFASGEAIWFGHGSAAMITTYAHNWTRPNDTNLGAASAVLLEENNVFLGSGTKVESLSENGDISFSLTLPGNTNAVSAIVRDGAGVLWFGTAGSGLYEYTTSGSGMVHHTLADNLPGNSIRDLAVDSTGAVWVATDGGVAVRANGYWLPLTKETSPLASNNVTSLAIDAVGTGRIWMGTAASGISILDPQGTGPDAWSTMTTVNGVPSNMIRALDSTDSGNIWVATGSGVGFWKATTGMWTGYTQADGALPSNDAVTIADDHHGGVWVGTAQGLAHYDPMTWKWHSYFPTRSALKANRVVALDLDDEYVWVVAGSSLAVRGPVNTIIGNVTPTITGFSPLVVSPTGVITVTGTGFVPGETQLNFSQIASDKSLRFGFQAGPGYANSPTIMAFKVPILAHSGNLRINSAGMLSLQSAAQVKVIPRVNSVSETCQSHGSLLTITGFGFKAEDQLLYVKVGTTGAFRKADMWTANSANFFLLPGDTSGKVFVRLGPNGVVVESPNTVEIAGVEVADIMHQQGIEGPHLVWGKRTLVQVNLRSTGSPACSAHVDGGVLHWKTTHPDYPLVYGADAFFTAPNGLDVNAGDAFSKSLRANVNFVASQPFKFRMSKFDGMRITITNGPAKIKLMTLDIPKDDFFFEDMANLTGVPVYELAVMEIRNPNVPYDPAVTRNNLNAMARLLPFDDIHQKWIYMLPPAEYKDKVNLSTWDKCSQARDFDTVTDMLDDNYDVGDTGFVLIDQSLNPGLGTGGLSCPDSWVTAAFNKPLTGGAFMAHEIGHETGRVSPFAANYNMEPGTGLHSRFDAGGKDCDPDYTLRAALKTQLGFVPHVVTLRASGAPIEFDLVGCSDRETMPGALMAPTLYGTNDQVFLEPYDRTLIIRDLCSEHRNSCITMNELDRAGQLPQDAAAADGTQPLAVTPSRLHLSGWIDTTNHVTATAFYTMENELVWVYEPPTLNQDHDAFHLTLFDAAGVAVGDYPFTLPFTYTNSHDNEGGAAAQAIATMSRFKLAVPFPTGVVTAKIFRADGTEAIWSQTATPNRPSVAITSPAGGTFRASDPLTITWSASDVDNDTLRFGLEYSPGVGQPWVKLPRYQHLTGSSFTWRPEFVPVGSAARLRIRVSDGFNTAVAESAAFSLTPRAPVAVILDLEPDSPPLSPEAPNATTMIVPNAGKTGYFTEGEFVTFRGASQTSEGIDQGDFKWTLDGAPLGSGIEISTSLTTVGTHTLGLSVAANGFIGGDTVTITVLPDYDHDGLPNDYELAYALNPLDGKDGRSDTDMDTMTALHEYGLGTHPQQTDTDGDGASDGSEVRDGTDPLRAASVPSATPVLLVGVDSMGFERTSSDALPTEQSTWIMNNGGGMLTWTATSDTPWVHVTPNGSESEQLRVTVAGMPPGEHHATITISQTGTTTTHMIHVTYRVKAHAPSILYLPMVRR